LHAIVEDHLDLTAFDQRYRNDQTGRLAYDPKVLLKIVIYGYYKGLLSSRQLEEACQRNSIFMALSADTRQHFTTIASFVSELHASTGWPVQDLALLWPGQTRYRQKVSCSFRRSPRLPA
jgi:transposase